ncbi:hypothetical protein V9T40_006593 [Parthenolecanium corni]|uniref:phosphoserine transaminase n=1 Tax=Parthenolecanium corni TaxID=536013 RepID=A0AAN9TL43_9HEMI
MVPEEVVNFGAGPAKLPPEVLLEVQQELLNYGDTGIGVMEMSHRSSTYDKIHNDTINLFKEILDVPDNYKILFVHGGGRGAFAAVALNLIQKTGEADYLITGTWSNIAAQDAEIFGKVNRVIPPLAKGQNAPDLSDLKLSENASYFYYCANETIEGFELPVVPPITNVPIVCDMSSNILTKKIDVSKYGVVLFCVQKNIGPAGVAVLIVREDLIGSKKPNCPVFLDFSVVSKSNSLLNTPPTFVIYVCGKVLKHVKKVGGIQAMEKLCRIKSEILYNLIDDSDGFFINEVHPTCRSRINVTFRIKGGKEVEDKFLELAQKAGMIQLKGHRSVSGIRASLYNAITVEEVAKLAGLMRLFEGEYSFHNKLQNGDADK